MQLMNRFTEVADNVCKFLIVLFLMVMTVLLFVQVVARYGFSYGITWSEELSRYLMIWMIYLGVAVVFREKGHISVTAIEETFPGLRRPLAIIQKIICVVFMALMGWFALGTLEYAALQTSPNMMLPMDYIYLCFPICAVLSIVYLVLGIVEDFTGGER